MGRDWSTIERAGIALAVVACLVIALFGWYEVGIAMAVPLLVGAWIAAGRHGRL